MSHTCGPNCVWSCPDARQKHNWSSPWTPAPAPADAGHTQGAGFPPMWVKRCRGVCVDPENPHFRERCSDAEWLRASVQPATKVRLYKLQGRVLG